MTTRPHVTVRMDPQVIEAFVAYCATRGWQKTQFLERAVKGLLLECRGGVPELDELDEFFGPRWDVPAADPDDKPARIKARQDAARRAFAR